MALGAHKKIDDFYIFLAPRVNKNAFIDDFEYIFVWLERLKDYGMHEESRRVHDDPCFWVMNVVSWMRTLSYEKF